jgi:hypothetical protein
MRRIASCRVKKIAAGGEEGNMEVAEMTDEHRKRNSRENH